MSFEKSFNKLNDSISKIRDSKAPLEDSIRAYKEGMAAANECVNKLNKAEKDVYEIRSAFDGKFEEVGFEFNPRDK
jgi:exodeoxyribonuclease VII small subunit